MRVHGKALLDKLKNQIIVSVQASEGEPLNKPEILEAMALSVLQGGAVALRMANTVKDDSIGYFKTRHPEVPVIALTKPVHIPQDAYNHVYITPNKTDIDTLIASGGDIIAMDATQRKRPGGDSLSDLVSHCRKISPDTLLMADVATLGEGLAAEKLGFDLMSTTLSGYTAETKDSATDKPDFALLAELVKKTKLPIVMEGRIWEPGEVTRAFELGAYAVVIGSAITRPHYITRRFCNALP